MTAELIALTDELRATNAMLGQVTQRLDVADRAARRHRFGTWVLACVVVAVVVLGWSDWRERQDEMHQDCMEANATRADIRASIVETVLVIIDGTDNPERLAPLVERIQERLETTIPDRSC